MAAVGNSSVSELQVDESFISYEKIERRLEEYKQAHFVEFWKPTFSLSFLCRTFKQNCPAYIALKVNEEGTALTVRSVNYEHNHPVSKVWLLS